MFSISMFRLAACNRNYVPSIIPSETTNTLCVTTKKNNVVSSSKTIQIGNILYTVPCFLVNHVDELKLLLKKMNISDAIKVLAVKYGVDLNPVIKNVKRYKYSIVSVNLLPSVIQFSVSFKLDEHVYGLGGIYENSDLYTVYEADSRYISICNNDTVTFSKTIQEFESLSVYWWSTLPTLPFYAAINKVNSNNSVTTQTGKVSRRGERIFFTPIIFNDFVFVYKPYEENTSFKILYAGSMFDSAISVVTDILHETRFSCLYK